MRNINSAFRNFFTEKQKVQETEIGKEIANE